MNEHRPDHWYRVRFYSTRSVSHVLHYIADGVTACGRVGDRISWEWTDRSRGKCGECEKAVARGELG